MIALIFLLHLVQPPIQPLYNIDQAIANAVQFRDIKQEAGIVCEDNKGFWQMLQGATLIGASETREISQTVFICGNDLTIEGFHLDFRGMIPTEISFNPGRPEVFTSTPQPTSDVLPTGTAYFSQPIDYRKSNPVKTWSCPLVPDFVAAGPSSTVTGSPMKVIESDKPFPDCTLLQ
jgi:hypothetical protein